MTEPATPGMAERIRSNLPVWRDNFRLWRRSRPFWGGLVLAAAGLELLWSSHLNMGAQVTAPGFEGFMAYLLPGILSSAGVIIWFAYKQRVLYSVIAIITSLYALIGLNLGGFFLGTLLGIVGAAWAFAWTPIAPASAAEDAPPPTTEESTEDGRTVPSGPRHLAGIIALIVMIIGVAVTVPERADAADLSGAPDNPGKLTASRLDVTGFAFKGVVTVSSAKGTYRALKFTMDTSVLQDFNLVTDGKAGRSLQSRSRTLTISGNVSLYVSRFSGKLLGIPLTFTPTFPPPLTLPTMTFTSVSADLVQMEADRLSGPTLHESLIA